MSSVNTAMVINSVPFFFLKRFREDMEMACKLLNLKEVNFEKLNISEGYNEDLSAMLTKSVILMDKKCQ